MAVRVPRVFHAFWAGSPLPPEWARCLAAWRRLHPDWELIMWDPSNIPHLGELQPFWDDPELWSPKSHVWQHRTNLLRLVLLAKHGGVWVDVDLEPLRPIDPLIDGADCFAGWEQQDVWINNCLLGATPNHPAVNVLLDAAPGSIRSQPNRRSNWQTGAHLLTAHWQQRTDVTLLDQQHVMPYHWPQAKDIPISGAAGRFPDAWLVHHWGNRRRILAGQQ